MYITSFLPKMNYPLDVQYNYIDTYFFNTAHSICQKSNDYKANRDAAIYIERCMYNDYSICNCTMPQKKKEKK